MTLFKKAVALKALFVAALIGMTACQQTTEEVYTPAAKPAAVQQAAVNNTDGINASLVRLTKSAPAEASLGEVYKNTLTATAKRNNLATLTITDKLPAGAEFVKAEPAAQVSGNTLTWTFSNVAEGPVHT